MDSCLVLTECFSRRILRFSTLPIDLIHCVFRFEELNLVESLVQLLYLFEKATQIVCADKTQTMHEVLPLAMKLVKGVAHQEG